MALNQRELCLNISDLIMETVNIKAGMISEMEYDKQTH